MFSAIELFLKATPHFQYSLATHRHAGEATQWTHSNGWWEAEKQDHFCCLQQKTPEQGLGQPLP